MSRPTIATIAGLSFVVIYMAVVTTLPNLVGRFYWPIEAVYWLIAGLVWVLPIRWLMLWSVHKR